MSQRGSGYKRRRNEAYQTPSWVTRKLGPHLVKVKNIWEPASGKGQMVRALRRLGFKVAGTDLTRGTDFLTTSKMPVFDAIVTNPPYNMHDAFIERALQLTEPHRGAVAMLLRVDFDSGKTRHHLFRDNPAWCKKIVLTRRIVWFARPGAAPSYNHAWYLWDWRHEGPPTIAYEA